MPRNCLESRLRVHDSVKVRLRPNIRDMDPDISIGSCLSGFLVCLQSEFLFVFDLFLFYLFVEVAPVAASDDELVDLELG